MDDWQDTAFSNRHVHNRSSKSKNKASKSGGDTDVTKLFGTYTISCPSAAKIAGNSSQQAPDAKAKYEGRLELYRLNDEGNALIAALVLPEALHAGSVVLAGSRKVMKDVIGGLEEEDDDDEGDDEDEEDGDEDAAADATASPASSDSATAVEASFEPNPASQRHSRSSSNFEKNSFRSLKFWVRFQGELLGSSLAEPKDSVHPGTVLEGSGYWIWPGAQTDHFSGTLSCEHFEWDNVKIEGWKIKSCKTRDYRVTWLKS